MQSFPKVERNYEEQVYAGVLGKVIGVYMGRPFEGWKKERLEKTWGRIDRYVHEDRNVPLVVADDDITGTFTFVRALEDSGLYEHTPPAFFGDTWLNYIIENCSILWWGGMGHSTEHTAFLRLKNGVPAPQSGSMALNGRIVAEQIGAQIFIDAFGLVAPGRPGLAADLARKAAAVSHDGEAVHAAAVVAGMVSAAFVQKDMDRLLDTGAALIPADSLIARVHRDVRAWSRKDRDWRKTWERIDRAYGYHKYGGNCHVVPNHAIMVMAWCYAPDNFHAAQMIINTAGWDTDCNAANVGSVMGVKVGLDRICESYDFRTPFADLMYLPTAEPTRSISDCQAEALHIARIGRHIMGWKPLPPPKGGVLHSFALPGALHGYAADGATIETRGAARLANVAGHSRLGQRSLRVEFDCGPGRVARVSTPVLPPESGSGYRTGGASRVHPGMTVRLTGTAGVLRGETELRLWVRTTDDTETPAAPVVVHSRPVKLVARRPFAASLRVPDLAGWPVCAIGFDIRSAGRAAGEVFVDTVDVTGRPSLRFPALLRRRKDGTLTGWLGHWDMLRYGFSDDRGEITHFGKNEGRGLVVTGSLDWTDYRVSARVKVHLAEKAGIVARYQGLRRYVALVKTADRLQLVLQHYGETVLAECPCRWKADSLHELALECRGATLRAFCDGKAVLEGRDDAHGGGAAGLLFERGLVGFRDIAIT